jgi:hypothetical protein
LQFATHGALTQKCAVHKPGMSLSLVFVDNEVVGRTSEKGEAVAKAHMKLYISVVRAAMAIV